MAVGDPLDLEVRLLRLGALRAVVVRGEGVLALSVPGAQQAPAGLGAVVPGQAYVDAVGGEGVGQSPVEAPQRVVGDVDDRGEGLGHLGGLPQIGPGRLVVVVRAQEVAGGLDAAGPAVRAVPEPFGDGPAGLRGEHAAEHGARDPAVEHVHDGPRLERRVLADGEVVRGAAPAGDGLGRLGDGRVLVGCCHVLLLRGVCVGEGVGGTASGGAGARCGGVAGLRHWPRPVSPRPPAGRARGRRGWRGAARRSARRA